MRPQQTRWWNKLYTRFEEAKDRHGTKIKVATKTCMTIAEVSRGHFASCGRCGGRYEIFEMKGRVWTPTAAGECSAVIHSYYMHGCEAVDGPKNDWDGTFWVAGHISFNGVDIMVDEDCLDAEFADGDAATRLFWDACENNDLDLAKELVTTHAVDIHAGQEKAFRAACRRGNLHTAQWLMTASNDTVDTYAGEGTADEAFVVACGHNHLHVAQWLFAIADNPLRNIRKAFKAACQAGHREVVAWMCETVGVEYGAVELACSSGNLGMAQWVMGRWPPPISIYGAFSRACHRGHLEIAQWLHGLGSADIHAHWLFEGTCSRGKFEVAQWLHGLDPDSRKWSAYHLDMLQNWWWRGRSDMRHAWISACVRVRAK